MVVVRARSLSSCYKHGVTLHGARRSTRYPPKRLPSSRSFASRHASKRSGLEFLLRQAVGKLRSCLQFRRPHLARRQVELPLRLGRRHTWPRGLGLGATLHELKPRAACASAGGRRAHLCPIASIARALTFRLIGAQRPLSENPLPVLILPCPPTLGQRAHEARGAERAEAKQRHQQRA